MERCTGFAPSVDENCTTLILGSMPSVKSLEENQYYAHAAEPLLEAYGDIFQ